VVTCNIDNDLDIENVEYMDILIYQLEKLLKKLEEKQIKLGDNALKSLKTWSEERIKEINTSLKGGAELKVGGKTNNLFTLLTGMFTELRVGVSGSVERAEKVRSVLKNRFGDFANKFNEFIEEANTAIRTGQNGQEVLFIIDGLEKTFSAKVRERIFTDESNRISQIKAYTIFTLPIELFKYRRKL